MFALKRQVSKCASLGVGEKVQSMGTNNLDKVTQFFSEMSGSLQFILLLLCKVQNLPLTWEQCQHKVFVCLNQIKPVSFMVV